MKQLLSIAAIFLIFFVGCSEESIVSSNPASAQNDYKLIKLPASTGLQVNNIYSDTKQIEGSQGGSLSFQGSFSGGPYGTVTVNAALEFPEGSFNGLKTISMTADDEYCASTFLPGMSFWKPGIYNITYTGVDLSGINPSTVKFVYIKQDGTLEYPFHEGITVDCTTGKISVENAKLDHFSRYGFVN